MRALEFLIWERENGYCPHSKEGDGLGEPSNGELRRWIKQGAVRVNQKLISLTDEIQWPIDDLVFFPNNPKSKCTIR